MMLYSKYGGKRVADKKEKKSFKLFKQKGGKRLAEKPKENDHFYQTIQFISGKIKNLSIRLKECINWEEEDQESMESEEIIPVTKEFLATLFPFEPDYTRIITIQANAIDDIDDVLYYLEEGYVIIVSYKTLNGEARKEFDRRLSKELMLLGTHLTHISTTEIICAGRHISIVDNISEKKEGKIYYFQEAKKR